MLSGIRRDYGMDEKNYKKVQHAVRMKPEERQEMNRIVWFYTNLTHEPALQVSTSELLFKGFEFKFLKDRFVPFVRYEFLSWLILKLEPVPVTEEVSFLRNKGQ